MLKNIDLVDSSINSAKEFLKVFNNAFVEKFRDADPILYIKALDLKKSLSQQAIFGIQRRSELNDSPFLKFNYEADRKLFEGCLADFGKHSDIVLKFLKGEKDAAKQSRRSLIKYYIDDNEKSIAEEQLMHKATEKLHSAREKCKFYYSLMGMDYESSGDEDNIFSSKERENGQVFRDGFVESGKEFIEDLPAISGQLLKLAPLVLKELAVKIWDVASNPTESIESLVNLLQTVPELPEKIGQYFSSKFEEFNNLSEREQSFESGKFVFEILKACAIRKAGSYIQAGYSRVAFERLGFAAGKVGKGGVKKQLGRAAKNVNLAPEVNCKNFKFVDKKYLKSVGIYDPHDFKMEFLGDKAKLSNFDIAKNTKTEELLIIKKSTKEVICNTGKKC